MSLAKQGVLGLLLACPLAHSLDVGMFALHCTACEKLDCSLIPCQRDTTVVPNHYNMVNATQSNSRNARNSHNKPANRNNQTTDAVEVARK